MLRYETQGNKIREQSVSVNRLVVLFLVIIVIIVVSAGVSVAYGVGGGRFTKPVSYVVDGASFISNMVLADLRNNGLRDIVTNGYTAISVLLNTGKGTFEDGIWTTVAGGAGCR